jgi:hypothetical protein
LIVRNVIISGESIYSGQDRPRVNLDTFINRCRVITLTALKRKLVMHIKPECVSVLLILLFATASNAQQKCTSSLAISPIDSSIVSKGFTARVIASNLTTPRGIAFDKEGNLLVVEKTKGITALQIKEEGNCITAVTKKTVITDPTVGGLIKNT